MTFAISSGVPHLPKGTLFTKFSNTFSSPRSSKVGSHISVRHNPGAHALTRTPLLAHSLERFLVSVFSPPFDADLIWSNITDILREAHLELSDIVSITTYVVSGNSLEEVMHSRDQQLGNHKPASTLVVVQELANAEWKMEISVVAIK